MRNIAIGIAFATIIVAGPSSANLLQNGDFSAGTAGFSTDYPFVANDGTVYTLPPSVSLTHNPGTEFTNGYLSYGDHTSGTGYMLLFDGDGAALDVWRETVTLAAATQYVFSYYATTPDGGQPSGSDLGDLAFKLNGTALGHTLITGQGGSGWQLITTTFSTGAAGSYTLALADLNATAGDNDDTIDDLSLDQAAAAVPEPGSWALMLLGFAGTGAALRNARGFGRVSAAAARSC